MNNSIKLSVIGAMTLLLVGCALNAGQIDRKLDGCDDHDLLTVVEYKESGAVADIYCAPQEEDVDVASQKKNSWLLKLLGGF